MKRIIKSASDDTVNEALQTAINSLKDDFDFILDGFDLLDRRGAESSLEATSIAEKLQSYFAEIIDELASKVKE